VGLARPQLKRNPLDGAHARTAGDISNLKLYLPERHGPSTMRVFLLLGPLIMALSAPISAQWTSSVSKDEMTGGRQAFAHSPMTSPTRPMRFPYTATQAWLGFGCDGENEWTYVGFSNQPNLTNSVTHDGYNSVSTRVKWDDQVETMGFTQTWGDSFVDFEDDQEAIAKMTTAGTLLLELEWYGTGQVYFRFSLRGSSTAVAKARAVCKT
jgi:hypothetical protein